MIQNNLSLMIGKKRIKMAELARMTGLNKNTILNLYHEKSKRIEFKVIDKLCRALKCQPGDLFLYVPDKETNERKDNFYNEEEIAELYKEFAKEDINLAEEG